MTLRIKADLFWQDTMNVVIPEGISCQLFRYGYFEEGLTRMLLEVMKPGVVVFDIGAHFGYYTLLSSHLTGNEGEVHAFEPVPTTFDMLKFNSRHLQNVVLNNIGMSSRDGVVELNDYGIEYCAYNSSKPARIDRNLKRRLNPQRLTAKATSLDSYVKNTGTRPYFVKIDAESAEWEIVHGARSVLTDMRPIVSLEVGDLDIEGVPSSRDLVLHILEYDYEVYEYGSLIQPLVRHEIKKRYGYDNLLFMPSRQ